MLSASDTHKLRAPFVNGYNATRCIEKLRGSTVGDVVFGPFPSGSGTPTAEEFSEWSAVSSSSLQVEQPDGVWI